MTGQRALTALRSHARPGFLDRWRNRHEDPFAGPEADAQDGAADITEAMQALEPLPRAPWPDAKVSVTYPPQGDPDDGAYYGQTLTDPHPHAPRLYADDTRTVRVGTRQAAASPAGDVLRLPPMPVTAAECAARMGRLAYPEPDSTRDRYAAVMRQVSAYTGTTSSFDDPAAWVSARPGPASAPVTSWAPQRPARLALEAGEVAA